MHLLISFLFVIFFSLHSNASPIMRIAHRGAPTFAPENTMPSFLKAVELKANFLELDVHQTKDNQLVVLHDKSIDRTTTGKGKVSELTLNEIQGFDAGSWFDEKFKGQIVPTLDAVLNILEQHPELKAIVELKGNADSYPGMAERIVALIDKKNFSDRVIYKSFDPKMLNHLKKLSPSTPSLYVFLLSIPGIPLTINYSLSFQSPFKVETQYLQEHYYFITKKFVTEAHAKGYKVIAWGVDSQDQIKKSMAIGVDGIETDKLDLLDKILR